MRTKSYGRRRLPSYSIVASTLALVFSLAALCVGGAMATGVLVTSKQIKNGSILTQDIHKNAVKGKDIGAGAVGSEDLKDGSVQGTDIGTGQVDSSDIGNGDVTPQDVTMPDPVQLQEGAGDVATASVTTTAALVDVVGSYTKEDASSVLEVDWTGTAAGDFSPCVFQIRVDGKPSGAATGEVYAHSATSVSASTLFSGLPIGPHQIEIWAWHPEIAASYPCTVGPASMGIGQTIVVSEQVV